MTDSNSTGAEQGQPWQRSTRIWITVAGILGAATMALILGWLYVSISGIQSEIAQVDQRITDLESAVASEVAAADISPVPTATAPAETTTEVDPDESTEAAAESDSDRQIAIIESAEWLEGPLLTLDYIQFLTGADAVAAATAAGDESPPPNDFYIVNANPKLRTFNVDPSASVEVVWNSDGTNDSGGHSVTVSEFYDLLEGSVSGPMRSTPYWVTIENGTITAIEAQYTP